MNGKISEFFVRNFGSISVVVIKIINNLLMNEAEYLMKNYGDRGGCYLLRPKTEADITPPEISIVLRMMRKPNSIIVLLFIQNNS